MAKRITSPQDLKALQEKARSDINLRTGPKDIRITVHMGTCGIAAGARDVLTALMNALGAAAADNVTITQTGCAGLCDQEPMLTLADKAGGSFRYGKLDKHKIGEIVREHVLRGQPVVEYLIKV
ncbi:MAG: (2Fe-2S) ferredoxin domain-containing protein [Phycisphaerae bacterium]|jgi:(2Fe-2S) ferredoxin|nr:(2Fe-2S) ferredoxin domain-containing protein [Phycisphaerae bacterium]